MGAPAFSPATSPGHPAHRWPRWYGDLPMSADASTVRAKTATVVKTVKYSKFGTIFVNTEAFALYVSSKDTKNHSNCTGQCIALWPPLVVPAGVTPIGKGVSGLGVATRPSGQHQVTYKNKPLYLFVSDKKRGQVTGQGVSGFSVVKPGAANTPTSASTT